MIVYRTSKVYPQVVEDSLGSSTSVFYGNLGPSLSNLAQEPIAVVPSVVSGELRPLLRGASLTDTAAFSPGLAGCELREVLRSTTTDTEFVASSAAVVGGTLKPALIAYATNEEVAAFSATIVSGNLS